MLTGKCHCGAVHWTFEGIPEGATSCNCTLCRRYGALWIYDFEDERIHIKGPISTYWRQDTPTPWMDIQFCRTCACVVGWRGRGLDSDGRRRMAVNIRLAEPDTVAHLPIDQFDGLGSFDDLPRDGRCVEDMWF